MTFGLSPEPQQEMDLVLTTDHDIKVLGTKNYISACQFLNTLNRDFPICYLGGNGRFEIVATSFSEVEPSIFLNIDPISDLKVESDLDSPHSALPFTAGYMGVIPYNKSFSLAAKKSKIYRVNQSLVFDNEKKIIHLCGDRSKMDTWTLEPEFIKKALSSDCRLSDKSEPIEIVSKDTDEEYLENAAEAISQIKSGRFYQINLLRYFSVPVSPNRDQLLTRIDQISGPQACYFDFPEYSICSFSPEQFFKLLPKSNGLEISTKPIKGTAERSENIKKDSENRLMLEKSSKDHAELHMIVDLMRNDLNSICKSGTVNVISPGEVQSFAKVHHLVAEIKGQVKENISIGDILNRLTPGGSITGAPKIEVMKAINEFEKREREFFMGNAFYLGDDGRFDSSILIRTLTKDDSQNWSYAAGSGIVVNSDPESERREIYTKCRVVCDKI